MATLPFHPLTLRFPSAYTEAAFRSDYERRSRGLVRASLALGLVQYAGFGFLDPFVAPAAFHEIRAIRVVVCVLVALAIGASWVEGLRRRFVPSIVGAVAAGLGVAAMEGFVQTAMYAASVATPGRFEILDGYYYSGLMLILVYVHVLLRLRFVTATTIGAGLVAVYLAVASLHTPPIRIVNAGMFLGSIQFAGMVASYALERYARLEFVQARRQAQTNATLTEALTKLGAAQAQVARQERMASLGRVTAGVAHEMRNPLNFVNNFAGLAEELAAEIDEALGAAGDRPAREVRAQLDETLADLRHNVQAIAEHGGRAAEIVQGMLEHTRTVPASRQPADLNALVRQSAERAAEHTFRRGDAGCDLAFDLDPAVGVVEVAEAEVGRVVGHLVGNACLAVRDRRTAEGEGYVPAIRVATRRRGGRVEVRVEDNGPGVPDDARERVFEPFFTTRPPGQGTGLGLSVSHEIIVGGHGGMLNLESAPDGGAAFVITLPARPVAEAEADEPLARLA